MTIEEEIERCKEIAKQCEYNVSRYDLTDAFESYCAGQEGECGERHTQVAEWLKQLKAVKDIIARHDADSMPEDYWYIDKIREVLNEK